MAKLIFSKLYTILKPEPAFRLKQIHKAWFDVSLNSYGQITTLPQELRNKLKAIPWLCLKDKLILSSKIDNTKKILFELDDGNLIETVVMGRNNKKINASDDSADRYTICISSQAGCAMNCIFCATGRAGFKRNLTTEEIVDQIRFCQILLAKQNAKIKNIVVMGQGEPLLNYDNVKQALKIILDNTNIGPTKITVSTCGVKKAMEQLLVDANFPPVRWAISLHSAIEETRTKIMPAQAKGFLDFLIKWAGEYHRKFGTKTHFVGLEYIMLNGVNDDDKHLKALIKLAKKLPHVRVNLIPFNSGVKQTKSPLEGGRGMLANNSLTRASQNTIEHFHQSLMQAGFTSTIRYSQGQDIFAACGQLSNQGR